MSKTRIWVLPIITSLGCGVDGVSGPELTGDCFVDPPQLEIGEGESSFLPLSQGDNVVIVHGPQGGWHITGAVRATGIGQIARIRFSVEHLNSGVFVTDYDYNVAMVMEDDCTGSFINMTGFITVSEMEGGDVLLPPDLLEDEELRITMEVDDFGERSVVRSVTVVGERHPLDMEE